MDKPASPWALDTSAGRPILVYEGCSVIEGEQAEHLLRLIVADAVAAPPAAEASYDKKALNVLLNDFARACAFGADATGRMKAAKAIHDWASAALAAAPAAVERQLPDKMDDELRDILGTVCFRAIHFAQAARSVGHQIDTKAEAEQAAFIWWKLGHYLNHGAAGWRAAAVADLEAMKARALGIGSDNEGAAAC